MRKKMVSDQIQYPNELTRGTKPHLCVKYIKLWSALGPLDYKDFNTEDLMALWGCQDDQTRKALTELEKTNWAVVEKLPKRMKRVWVMHTPQDTEKHLKRMKDRVETHREMNMGRVKDYAEKYAKQSYRAEKLSEKKTNGYKYVRKAILNQGLTDTEVYVFLGLWSFGETSSAETAVTAETLGLSLRTFTRALAVLKDHGALTTAKHPQYGTNVYTMKTDWMTQQNRLDDLADPAKPTGWHTIENESSRENDLDTEPAVPEAPKDSPRDNQGEALVDTNIPGLPNRELDKKDKDLPLVDVVAAPASPTTDTEEEKVFDRVRVSDDSSASYGHHIPRPRPASTYQEDRKTLDNQKRDRQQGKLKAQEARMEARRAEQKASKARILGEPQTATEALTGSPGAVDPMARVREYLNRQQTATAQQ